MREKRAVKCVLVGTPTRRLSSRHLKALVGDVAGLGAERGVAGLEGESQGVGRGQDLDAA